MEVYQHDNQKSLDRFMSVVSGPLRDVFQGGNIYNTRARQILHEFVRHDNDSAHVDHVKETRYNVAWRNWAMICDLAEKVWLHYLGTLDKMMDTFSSVQLLQP